MPLGGSLSNLRASRRDIKVRDSQSTPKGLYGLPRDLYVGPRYYLLQSWDFPHLNRSGLRLQLFIQLGKLSPKLLSKYKEASA